MGDIKQNTLNTSIKQNIKELKDINQNVNVKDKNSDKASSILTIYNDIIDTCVDILMEQIKNNNYYIKYIIVFDYRYLSRFNLNYNLPKNLLDDCIQNLKFDKDHIDSILMIPKTYSIDTTPIYILKEGLRNLFELRIKGEKTKYQNLYLLYSQII